MTTTGGHSCFHCLHVQLYKVLIRGFVLILGICLIRVRVVYVSSTVKEEQRYKVS